MVYCREDSGEGGCEGLGEVGWEDSVEGYIVVLTIVIEVLYLEVLDDSM